MDSDNDSQNDWDGDQEDEMPLSISPDVSKSSSKIVLQLSPHPDHLPKLLVRNKVKKSKDEMQVDPNDWSNQEGRYMKSSDQVKILENEFSKEPTWSKEKMKKLARLLNLKDSQIYKWNWDRR
jgi:succinate dehydrogenase flavin-adding protein (antitoxin of CptAB toxin-antitoxin module)